MSDQIQLELTYQTHLKGNNGDSLLDFPVSETVLERTVKGIRPTTHGDNTQLDLNDALLLVMCKLGTGLPKFAIYFCRFDPGLQTVAAPPYEKLLGQVCLRYSGDNSDPMVWYAKANDFKQLDPSHPPTNLNKKAVFAVFEDTTNKTLCELQMLAPDPANPGASICGAYCGHPIPADRARFCAAYGCP
jgi:hypothetical protein